MYAPLQAPKRLLFGPGPSLVSPRVYQAWRSRWSGISIRSSSSVEEIRSLLGYAFSTEQSVQPRDLRHGQLGDGGRPWPTSPSRAKFALLTNGFFGDRIGEMARRQGAEVVKLAKNWGEPYDPQEARDFIKRERPHMVAFVQAETSTGMYNQAKPICEAAHEVGALVIADCVTSLGGMPVLVDENGIDIAYSCTQKGLGCPPGLAPMTVSPRALERLQGADFSGALLVPRPAAAGRVLIRRRSTTIRLRRPCSMRCGRGWRWSRKRAGRTAGSGTG